MNAERRAATLERLAATPRVPLDEVGEYVFHGRFPYEGYVSKETLAWVLTEFSPLDSGLKIPYVYPTKPGDPDDCFTNTAIDLFPDKSRVVVLDEAGFIALLAGDERYELAIS